MGDSNLVGRVRRWTRAQLPSKTDFKNDAMAGLPGAISSVPDGMAARVLAGARTLQARLPDPSGAHAPGVVLRLRGRTALGATFFDVIAPYAAKLAEVDGTLIRPPPTDQERSGHG